MSKEIKAVFDLLRSLRRTMRLKASRGTDDVFTDRVIRACTESTLLQMAERLAADLDVALEYVPGRTFAAFARVAREPSAPLLLAWLRRHPRMAAMIAGLREDDDYAAALAAVVLPVEETREEGVAPACASYDVPIVVRCISPLAHGADAKAGNATLFRRCQVLSSSGRLLELPFYGGNALRGQLRDALADHLLCSLGLQAKGALALWFFHAIYAGGVLEETSQAHKAVRRELGDHGAVRADGVRTFREMLPAVSLLGAALGNRVLCGRISVGDLRPRCRQWGTGTADAAELMEWTYLTRREDREEYDDHRGMIATTECLRAGVVLDGGIDIDTHATEIERAALGRGLALLAERGLLGAENRRGLGRVTIEVSNMPDPASYDAFLVARRAAIIEYLSSIGALRARSDANQPGARSG